MPPLVFVTSRCAVQALQLLPSFQREDGAYWMPDPVSSTVILLRLASTGVNE